MAHRARRQTILIDGSLEGLASIAAATPSREAILEAAQALEDEQNERRSMHPKHMQVLFTALICRRSPYIVEVEREMAAYQGPHGDFTKHLAEHRPDLEPLFRSEIRKVIEEARRSDPVSESEPRRVFVGRLPSGTVAFVAEGEADPITILLRDADQRLAAERATREATREAEKAKLLQSARTGGKLRRLLGGGD